MDNNCSHETKRCLLLERKAMTNLDSILKSRNIILPEKVHIVKAMTFPVVMYGCESWTKKDWAPNNWYLCIVVLEKTLESSLDSKRSNQSILKEINPDYLLEGLMLKLKLQYFGHLMQNADIRKGHDAGKNWRQGEKVTTEDEIVGWYHWPIWHEFEQTPGIAEDRKAWCAAVHGISMSWTGLSNWTAETMNKLLNMLYFNPGASYSHLSVRTMVLYTEIAFSYLSTAT